MSEVMSKRASSRGSDAEQEKKKKKKKKKQKKSNQVAAETEPTTPAAQAESTNEKKVESELPFGKPMGYVTEVFDENFHSDDSELDGDAGESDFSDNELILGGTRGVTRMRRQPKKIPEMPDLLDKPTPVKAAVSAATLLAEDLRSKSKEVWLIRVPQKVTAASMDGMSVNMSKKNPSVKIGGKSYTFTLTGDATKPAGVRLKQSALIVPSKAKQRYCVAHGIDREAVLARKIKLPEIQMPSSIVPDYGQAKQHPDLYYHSVPFGAGPVVVSSSSLRVVEKQATPEGAEESGSDGIASSSSSSGRKKTDTKKKKNHKRKAAEMEADSDDGSDGQNQQQQHHDGESDDEQPRPVKRKRGTEKKKKRRNK